MIRYAVVGSRSFRRGTGLTYTKPSVQQTLFLYISAPSQAEIRKISKDFNISSLVFTQYKKEEFSRTLSVKPFQFMMRDYYVEQGAVKQARLLFVILNHTFVIVSDGRPKYYMALFNDIAEDMKDGDAKTVPQLLHSFLSRDVEDNFDVLEATEARIVQLESATAKGNGKENVNKILRLKKDLFKMSRQFQASAKIISILRRKHKMLDKRTNDGLAELHDTFSHQIDVAASQKEMVSDIVAVYSTQISNKLSIASNELNIVVKRLTAYALVIMVPTLITGIYGMNFRYLPLADHPQGFWIMLILMGISAIWLIKKLGRHGWL